MTPDDGPPRVEPGDGYPHRLRPVQLTWPGPGHGWGDLASQLRELVEFQNALEPFGFQGLIVACAKCQDEHLRSWASLRADVWQRLTTGNPPAHQPVFEPDLLAFITHGYARGFTDGLARDGDPHVDRPGPAH